MQLFQLDKFNLYYHIQDLSITPIEELATTNIDSLYLSGDKRASKNKTKSLRYQVTGTCKSQKLLHSLIDISENDNGRGDIKCFFGEKYLDTDINYKAISTIDESQAKLYFAYCYIDIQSRNQKTEVRNDNDEYLVDFIISIQHPSRLFEITNDFNAFFVPESFLKSTLQNRYDSNLLYDAGNLYDTFNKALDNSELGLQNQSKQKMSKYYDELTCCEGSEHIYIQLNDGIIKPFIDDNNYPQCGVISRDILNNKFVFKENENNFLQTYISNPANSTSQIQNKYINNVNFGRSLISPTPPANSSPYYIGNLNIDTNTQTKNAIIQIFRENFALNTYYQPASNPLNPNLFQEINQSIDIKILKGFKTNSHLRITCKSAFIRDNLFLLVIHPHNQKIYGILEPIGVNFTLNDFSFSTTSFLVDLEPYLLASEITITNETTNGNQSWFELSPSYKKSFYTNKSVDTIEFSTKFESPTTTFAVNKALFLQVLVYQENKLI
ncbi:MAG: hypothetical protein ACRCZ2_10080 [Fusobacteriaceae bacterium]